jgi:hypothetical protein
VEKSHGEHQGQIDVGTPGQSQAAIPSGSVLLSNWSGALRPPPIPETGENAGGHRRRYNQIKTQPSLSI